MAQDLTGLLGGALLPAAQPITPTSAQDYTRIMQEANKGFSQAVGGMFGVDTRTTPEFAQEEVVKLLQDPNFNQDDPNSQRKLVELVSLVDKPKAAQMAMQFAEQSKLRAQQRIQRESLINQAKSLGLIQTVADLETGGDMKEAAKQIKKLEEVDVLSNRGIKGQTLIAEQHNVPLPMLARIKRGDYKTLSPEDFTQLIRGDKQQLKAFLNENNEIVYGRVNDYTAQIYNEETGQWASPAELGYTPAPVTTKAITTADTVTGQLTKGATTDFLEINKAAQSAVKVLATTKVTRDILQEGVQTGFGTEWKNKTLDIIDSVGLLPQKYTDAVAATRALVASRSQAVLDSIEIFGGGQGFTENDRKFLENIKGANSSLTTETVQRLLDLEEKASLLAIDLNNSALEKVLKFAGDAEADNLSNYFFIQKPEVISQYTPLPVPAVGTSQGGYTFLGGDPANPASWRKD
jgi:hypothetical protein